MFSLNAPDGKIPSPISSLPSPVKWSMAATTKEDGAFECLLPTPVYTNVMLGTHTGEAHV